MDRLFSWSTRDSPKRDVCSSSLRGLFPKPLRCVIAVAINAIRIGDRTHMTRLGDMLCAFHIVANSCEISTSGCCDSAVRS